MKLIAAVIVTVLVAACTASPTAPDRQAGGPGVFRVSGDFEGRVTQNVAVTGMSLSRTPLRIQFFGNYPWRDADGVLRQPTEPHTLVRANIGGIRTNDDGAELEAYLNSTWFPREFRDSTGAIQGFAWIDIRAFSTNDADTDWTLCLSTVPISTCF